MKMVLSFSQLKVDSITWVVSIVSIMVVPNTELNLTSKEQAWK